MTATTSTAIEDPQPTTNRDLYEASFISMTHWLYRPRETAPTLHVADLDDPNTPVLVSLSSSAPFSEGAGSAEHMPLHVDEKTLPRGGYFLPKSAYLLAGGHTPFHRCTVVWFTGDPLFAAAIDTIDDVLVVAVPNADAVTQIARLTPEIFGVLWDQPVHIVMCLDEPRDEMVVDQVDPDIFLQEPVANCTGTLGIARLTLGPCTALAMRNLIDVVEWNSTRLLDQAV